jgi:putative transposase
MTTLSLLQAATAGQWINLIFRPRRYQLKATSYRHARSDALSLWVNYTAEMAA